jgi:hypothetical protein
MANLTKAQIDSRNKRRRERYKNITKEQKEKNNERNRKYYKQNPSKKLNENKKWREDNPDKFKKLIHDRYIKNKDNINIKKKQRMKVDKEFKTRSILRTNFSNSLKRYTSLGKIQKSSKYGFDMEKVIQHLKPFPEDIFYYHIDHIRPLHTFKFQNKDGTQNIEEIKKAFSPKNLQWLPCSENQSKGGKWDGVTNK